MSDAKFRMADLDALFKIKYEKLSENVYNSANVLLGRVKKSYDFTGKQLNIAIPQSFSGGVGSGKLPKPNRANYGEAQITSKKMYAVVQIDRETIKAALNDEGAFVRATKEVVKKGVESFMRNLSRALFNDGSGIIAEVASVSGQEITLKTSGTDHPFKEANLEERDMIDVLDATDGVTLLNSAQAGTGLEIDSVDDVNKKITVVGSISGTIAAGDKLVMQGSHKADPDGLKGVLQQKNRDASKSFNIVHGRKWEAVQEAASSAAISTDLLNKVMLKIKKKCGKSPNLIVTSFKQYEKILNLLEDKKQYTVPTRAGLKSKSGADISFTGVEFMSVDGPIGIFPERFVEDDTIYLLNDSHIHMYHRPDFGWFDDDGTVFLREANSDSYEARYGGYLECYINPCFHGVITGLSV
tara:strand:+ start:5060 stop:6295 length:1236 start_codon:yes stop_codon:yes gene_type:complete